MKNAFFLLFFLSFSLFVRSQRMFSRPFSLFNQLYFNEVYDIHQDKEGYLWIATTNGLARYDRYNLLNFRSDYRNINILADNYIVSVDDSKRYVWIASRGGLNLYDKRTCRINPFPDERFNDKSINCIVIDREESAWIGVENRIYHCDSTVVVVKEYVLQDSDSIDRNNINSIYVDKQNQVWVVTTGGIFRYDLLTDTFVHYPISEIGTAANVMFQDRMGNYWIGTWGMGLWQFFPEEKGIESCRRHHIINSRTGKEELIIFNIEQDDTLGYLWMLSYTGLHILKRTQEGILQEIDIHDLVDTQTMYTCLLKDREGNLWLGSYDMIYTIFFDVSNVDNYLVPQLRQQIGWDTNILNLCVDEDNMMWLWQDRHGVCLYDLSNDRFADAEVGEFNLLLKSLHKPGIWANSFDTPWVKRLVQQDMKVYVEEAIRIEGVIDLAEDQIGNLWISSAVGLKVKRSSDGMLLAANESTPQITFLTKDMHGEIWGISDDRQIYSLCCSGNEILYKLKGCVSILLDEEKVNDIAMDGKGCLWLVTSLGRLLHSDETMKFFNTVSMGGETNDCIVLGLLAESTCVWITTNKKVFCYDIYSQTHQTYDTTDENVQIDSFRYKAICSDGKGGVFAGGHRGLIHIRSSRPWMKNTIEQPRVHITDIKVQDRSLFFEDTLCISDNTIDKVSLSSDSRNIAISFSPLLYSPVHKYRMAYRLEGIDQEWVYTGYDKFSAFYNYLPRGTYRLHLKLEYMQGRWTEDEVLLTIVKEPAFHETWMAYLLYICIIGTCSYMVIRLYMRRIQLKSKQKLWEELTQFKLNYFTGISHELLTPLTVISCLSDYIEEQIPAIHQQTVMLKSNVDRLKRLIQQVLDFRKMDIGKLQLNVSNGDIRNFVLSICRNNFLPLAQKKHITLEMNMNVSDMQGYVDFDKLDKILHNLLSNALKYTPENKSVVVELDMLCQANHSILVLKVKDEGIGISDKELESIFTKFYNNRKGEDSNGIGLYLTKELVKLHHGTITVDSTLGKGSCFVVMLPIDYESYLSEELVDGAKIDLSDEVEEERNVDMKDGSCLADDGSKLVLLLIDDNTELLAVMKNMFYEYYHVLTASDVDQVWKTLRSQEVDVIICDVILPDVNGWKLCTHIKSDVAFNHIPILILTAKNGIDDRIASYEAGADGYIAKPFDKKLLFARINNLVKASKMRQDAFRKEENLDLEHLPYSSIDKKFLQLVIEKVESHLEQSEFYLEQLSVEMGMSRSTLYRKIKAVTGMAPLDFVRNIKMKRACMMLAEGKHHVSEVAYALGFNTPKYFTKCFKGEFGITPSEYMLKKSV